MTYPFLKNLTIEQQQQLMRFMERYNVFFDSGAHHMFSQSRFVMGRLLIGMNPSNTNKKNTLNKIIEQFLGDCSRKFGRLTSIQFMLRGRSQRINYQDITRLQEEDSIQKQFLSISHYGLAVLLGNTSAIAEMVRRLFKIHVYDSSGILVYSLYRQFLKLLEYGISHRCPDCIGVMAHFLNVGFYSIIQRDKQHALKLAGESVEGGSVIGCFVLVELLSNLDSFHQDKFGHEEIEDAIKILQEIIRNKNEGVLICIDHVVVHVEDSILVAIRVLQKKLIQFSMKQHLKV
jgi:hypothetical protein